LCKSLQRLLHVIAGVAQGIIHFSPKEMNFMLSENKGYKISIVTAEKNMLNVRAWGVWDAEDKKLAEHFTRELQDKVKELSAHEKDWSVCEDLAELRPQSREICRIMGDGLIFAIRHGMKKAVHCQK
jgi:hypothetical protein